MKYTKNRQKDYETKPNFKDYFVREGIEEVLQSISDKLNFKYRK